MNMIDPLYLKSIERKYNVTLTQQQIAIARYNNGFVTIDTPTGKVAVRLIVMSFPHDLIDQDNNQETTPWGQKYG